MKDSAILDKFWRNPEMDEKQNKISVRIFSNFHIFQNQKILKTLNLYRFI